MTMNILPKQSSREFITTDLPLAAYLTARGKKLVRIDRTGRQGFFVFLQNQIGSDPIDFTSGKARVDPLNYSLATRKLKAQLNEALRTGVVG